MKLKIFLLAIANAIGYYSHAQQQLTGAIDGVFDVSNLGAATYTIPVSIPDGIGGMKPAISINYSSQNRANGNLGIGWSVAGVSAISRAGSTLLLDGKMAGVTITTDKFALDGARLVRTGDLNSTSNYTYATESESFLKIESESAGHVFQSFKVTNSSGAYSEYGINSNAKQTLGGETYAWLLTRQTDLNGNTVNYDYYNVSGEELRMKSITYGGGSTPLNRITFHYINKAAQNFVYLLGQKIESKYKLDKITIESTGGTGNVYTLLYTYQFEYATQKDQLLKVRYISNFTNQEMPATNFKYENPAPAAYSSVLAHSSQGVDENIIVGDFNGDGKSDFIKYDNDFNGAPNLTWKLHLNNGENQFVEVHSGPMPSMIAQKKRKKFHYDRLNRSGFFDFNGDGREDFYTLKPWYMDDDNFTHEAYQLNPNKTYAEFRNEFRLFISTVDGSQAGGIKLMEDPNGKITRGGDPGRDFYASYPLVGDFDGDGRSELLIMEKLRLRDEQASQLKWYLFGERYRPLPGSTTTHPNATIEIGAAFLAEDVDHEDPWKRSEILVIDYNGDGKSDLLHVKEGAARVYEFNVSFNAQGYAVNPGFTEVSFDGYPTSAHMIFPGDFNGDGITDILTYVSSVGWEIGYGKGNGKFNDIRSVSSLNMLPPQYKCSNWEPELLRPILIADFDGDGKSDICEITDQFVTDPIPPCPAYYQPRIHYSKGNHIFQTQTYPLNVNGVQEISLSYKIGDFNGDGNVDIISRKEQDKNFYIHKFNAFDDTKLLTHVTNGLSVQTRIEYTKYTKDYFPLSNNAAYFTNVSYPFVSKNLPITLVKSVFKDAGFNGAYEGVIENRVNYDFKRLTWANLGRGMLGFQDIITNDIASNTTISQSTVFNNDKLLLLPYWTFITKNGTIISNARNQFEVRSFAGNRYGIYTTFTESVDNLTGQNVREDFVYQRTITDPSGFQNNETSYHIGKPLIKTISKGFYRSLFNLTSIDGALETITETYSYPSPFVVVIGNPTPFHRYFLPGRIQTTEVRKGQDPFSSDVRFVYNDAKGWLTKKRDNFGFPHAVTTDYTYNTFGNLVTQTVSTTGSPTAAETIEYDPTNRFVKTRYNTAYPLLKTTNTYNGYTGWINTAVDNEYGITETFGYDGFGRVTSVTDNTGLQKSTTMTPPEQGSTDDTRYTVAEFNNISNKNIWKNYDRLGRLLRTIRFDFNGDVLYEDMVYNGLGQLVTSSLPYKAIGGTPINTSINYDNLGRQNQISAPNGNTLISYNLVASINSSNNLSRYTITTTGTDAVPRATITDAAGKKVKSTDPGGSLDFTYHSSGQLLNTVLNGSTVTSSVYNGAGREVEKYDVNFGTYHYTYDNYGKLKTQIDPKGNQYVMDYDALGNLITKTGPEGTYNYTYNLTTAGFNLGKLTGVTAPGGISESYSYGSFGRQTQEVKSIDGISFTNAYAYDGFGRLSRKYFANFIQGITLNYGYNSNDGSYERTYLNGGTIQNPKNLYSVLKKNVLGQATLAGQHSVFYSGTMPNPNENPSYKFNASKQISAWGHLQYTSTTIPNSGGYYHEYSFEFNNADGKLNSRTNHFGLGEMEFFEYDNLNRLQSHFIYGATPSEIDYSQNGNISQKSDAGTFTYNSANKVAEIAPFTNIPGATQTITYTPFDKVGTITEGSITAHFKYWPNGERAKMELKNNGVTYRTKYYMEDFEREISNGQTRDLVYVRGENEQYVSIVERINNANEKTYSVMTDYLGSVERIVDNNTLVTIAYNNYDAWGRERNPNDWSYLPTTRNSNGWDRGYTGHEHIPEFGLINMNGRLYDPVLGRMLSPDPYIMGTDNTQGYNRYTYALNNPMTYTDPSGEFVWAPVIIGAVVGAYMGGTMANNNFNLFKWDYSSGNTWAYMGAGALVGAFSAGVGSAVSASGAPLAKTMGIVTSSFLNSAGTNIYTGGQTDISMNFGAFSYNFTDNEFGFLWKKGNSFMDNVGYGLGAFANLADMGKLGDMLYNVEKSHAINHAAFSEPNGNVVISYGPSELSRKLNYFESKGSGISGTRYFGKMMGGVRGTNDYSIKGRDIVTKGINTTIMKGYGQGLSYLSRKGIMPYSFVYSSCSTHAGLALGLSGVPNLFIHPYTLQASVWLWNQGITPGIIQNSYQLIK